MNKDTVSGDIIDLKLRQMHASKITYVNSNMYIVDFKLKSGIIVSYVFNITKGDKYFLQRMRPYAMVQGKYADTREIVHFIKKDLEKFRNAERSSNFKQFVDISKKSLDLAAAVENLFLNHNVPKDELDSINENLEHMLERIKAISEQSEEIILK